MAVDAAQNRRVMASDASAADSRLALEDAILRTLVYAHLFEYPLSLEEIRRYLPGVRATVDEVAECLRTLGDRVACTGHYYCLRGHEHLGTVRAARTEISAALWVRARRIARVLSLSPFIRMIAITGTLAVRNCRARDDIDLLVVTRSRRVWVTRGLIVLLAKLVRGQEPCPNFVLSEEAMALVHRNFYAARELAQMVPVYGGDVYERLLEANGWLRTYLPNVEGPPGLEPIRRIGWISTGLKHGIERLAGWCGADRVDAWELRRQTGRAAAAGRLHAPTVILDQHQCKAHFMDYAGEVQRRYDEALASVFHESDPASVAGTVKPYPWLARTR